MANNNEGPKLQDVNALMQQMSSGGQSGGGGDEKNQFEVITEGFMRILTRLLGKVGVKIRLNTLFKTSLFAQLTPSQAWSGKSVNEAAPSFAAKGGVLADTAVNKLQFKMDFSGIAKPAIEGLPVVDVPITALGSLAPSDFGGGGGRGAIGLG